jgi:Protein of unknown function (DUF3732)
VYVRALQQEAVSKRGIVDTTSKFSAAASAAGYLFQARLPDEDQAAVHKLFEVLNDYCKSLAPRMQVIVCDHVELLALQLPFVEGSESMDDHDSDIVDAGSVD